MATLNTMLESIIGNEAIRRRDFPVAEHCVYMAHAGVCPLPRCAADAIAAFAHAGARDNQEADWPLERVDEVRSFAADLIKARPNEIALLGPTSLGLNLVAHGLDWDAGDEVVFYGDDFPANVYPWRYLERYGVRSVAIQPPTPGAITWEILEPHLTPRTRLVSLASCHYLSGVRIDFDLMGRRLHERGILFCLDAIQTVGADPLSVEHIDFLSADSHKWMLGPAAAGIFYVDESHHDRLRPAIVGSFNVFSPEFIAQDRFDYYPGGRRYEPGMLNLAGIAGMEASIKMLLGIGIDAIAARRIELREGLVTRLEELGFNVYAANTYANVDGVYPTSIVTVSHPDRKAEDVFDTLNANRIAASLRQDRQGNSYVRFSPHFYNTFEELDHVADVLR